MRILINLLFFMISCFASYKAYKRNEKSHVMYKVIWTIFGFLFSIPYLIGILIYDEFIQPGNKSDLENKSNDSELKRVRFDENIKII